MEKILNLSMLGSKLKALKKEGVIKPSLVSRKSGRSRDILHRMENGQDVSVSALLDILNAAGLAIRIVPKGFPTQAEAQALLAESDDEYESFEVNNDD